MEAGRLGVRVSLPDSEVGTGEPSHPQDKPLTPLSAQLRVIVWSLMGLLFCFVEFLNQVGHGGKVKKPESSISRASTVPLRIGF